METILTVKQEYFGLVKKLNRANKLKNQITDVYFYIDTADLNHLKLLAAISESQKIILCEKIKSSRWIASGFSPYPHLENYIAQLLRTESYNDNLTKYIKLHIFKLLD